MRGERFELTMTIPVERVPRKAAMVGQRWGKQLDRVDGC